MNTIENRAIRQEMMIPSSELARVRATVVGCGAIGRQVSLQLAAIGVPRMTLIDFDRVEDVNLASQGFLESDLNELKVYAVADLAQSLNSQIAINQMPDPYTKFTARELKLGGDPTLTEVVFSCVDKMSARKVIFESLRGRKCLFVDGRMSAGTLRVLASTDEEHRDYYESTLFDDSESYNAGGRCTQQSTIHTASIAAGLMVQQFSIYLRGGKLTRDFGLNLHTLDVLYDNQ